MGFSSHGLEDLFDSKSSKDVLKTSIFLQYPLAFGKERKPAPGVFFRLKGYWIRHCSFRTWKCILYRTAGMAIAFPSRGTEVETGHDAIAGPP